MITEKMVLKSCQFVTCLCHNKPINKLHINVNRSVAPRLLIFIQSIVGSNIKMFVIKVAGHKNLDAYCQFYSKSKQISLEIAADWFPMYSLKCSNQKCFATKWELYYIMTHV